MAPPPRLPPAMAVTSLPMPYLSGALIPVRCRRPIGSSSLSALIPGCRIGSAFSFSCPEVESDVDYETCELVNGTEIIIGGGKDSVRAYLMKAMKNNNGNGVLLLSDALGFEDSSTRDFAYRVACSGYNILVPDLFRGNPWKAGRPLTEFGSWAATHSEERISSDIARSSQWLEEEFIAAGLSKSLGIIGFGFGAHHLIETLARDNSGRFGTGICFYGMDMNPAQAQSISVPVLFICGDSDAHCRPTTVHAMTERIPGAKALVYGGRGHGFAHRPESQEEDEDAEDAFAAARTWLHDFLVAC